MIDFKIAKILPVFKGQTYIKVKELLETLEFPYILVDDRDIVTGVLDEALFWKHVALMGLEIEIMDVASKNFKIIEEESDFLSEAGINSNIQYFIVKDNQSGYKVYNNCEREILSLREQKKCLMNVNDRLSVELDALRQKVSQLECILDSSYDEIFVTDGEGNTLFVSESTKKFTGHPPEIYIGKNLEELTKQGIIENSVTLKVMKSKKVLSHQQTYKNGTTVLATGKPVFNEEGEIILIITNSRDISELVELRNQINFANSIIDRQNQFLLESKSNPLFTKLNTQSEKMLPIIKLIEKVAPMDSSILIEGESGVGKNVVARLIHEKSKRKGKNFVQINCGAISPMLIESELFGYESGSFTGANKKGKAGLIEQADGGTLFLDEIGELALDLQVKLLHLVQEKSFIPVGGTKEKKVDIRIISATNKNLKQRIRENLFREDLYYRLHVVPIVIPPLRERVEDIPLLIEYFLGKFNERYEQTIRINDEVVQLLMGYDWSGNVRELENLMEQLIVTAKNSMISADDLPSHIIKENERKLPGVIVTGIIPLNKAVEEVEKQILKQALEKHKSSRKIAKALEVNQTTIIRKIHKYNLQNSKVLAD